MCPEEWGIGRDKVEGAHHKALPAVVHLINLELESLHAFKVRMLSLKALSGCKHVDKSFPFVMS